MSELSGRVASLSPEQRALLERMLATKGASPVPLAEAAGLQFSLFYFSSDEQALANDKYRLVLEGAQFADQHGFAAVWTPERHFDAFGGLYPNPAVLNAALAMVTRHIKLRAGSVVLPLHHPIRVVEEWSIVDNLSQGRIGIAFASGWHSNDFVFAPEQYDERKAVMFRNIDLVRRLWQGEAFAGQGGDGSGVELKLFPKPVQSVLPIWITATRSPETFVKAGEIGANVLTALIELSPEQLGERIKLYREARAQHGHDPATGHVTVMAHAFIGEDMEQVRAIVQAPFCRYLRANGELGKSSAKLKQGNLDLVLSRDDEEALLSFAFERYLNGRSLIGTPATCAPVVQRLQAAGVNEVACLIDFGVDVDTVMNNLSGIVRLKDEMKAMATGNATAQLQPAD